MNGIFHKARALASVCMLLAFSTCSFAQTINPSAPAQAGIGLSQAGSTLNVLYGSSANTAKQGNATDTVPQGGTGLATVPAYNLLLGNGTSAMTPLAPSATSGQVLTSTGSGSAPNWQTPPTAAVSSVFGQVGAIPNLSGAVTTSGSSVTSFGATGTATYPLVSNGTGSAALFQKLTYAGIASPNNTNQVLASDNGTAQWSYIYPSLIVPSETTGYILTTNSGGYPPNWEPFPALSGVITTASNSQVTSFSPGGTSGQVLTSNGASAPTWQSFAALSGGTSGQVLTSNGASAPSWQALPTTTASAAPQVTGASAAITASSSTATIAASYATLVSSTGQGISIPSPSASINISTTGAGGMDTGTAPTSGFVAIYYIYDQTTSTLSTLGVNATSAVQPEIYGGANMPAGYAYSALVAVVPTNAGATFAASGLDGRHVDIVSTAATPPYSSTLTTYTVAAAPLNSVKLYFVYNFESTGSSTCGILQSKTSALFPTATITISGSAATALNSYGSIATTGNSYYYWTNGIGSGSCTSFVIDANGYDF